MEESRERGPKCGVVLNLKHKVADALVYSKLREALGERIRALVSGGAPLAPELAWFFYGAGMPIYQGYGLTESSPVIACNTPGQIGSGRSASRSRASACGLPKTARFWLRGRTSCAAITTAPPRPERLWKPTPKGSLAAHGRRRPSGRRRLSFHHRPQERSDQDQRRQIRRAATDRERHQAQPIRQPGGGHRRRSQIPRRVDSSTDGSPARLRAAAGHRRRRTRVGKTPGDNRPDRKGGRIAHSRSITVREDQSGSAAPARTDGRRRRTTPTLKVKRRVVVEMNKGQIDRLYASKESK